MKKFLIPMISLLAVTSVVEAQNIGRSRIMKFDEPGDDLPIFLETQTSSCTVPTFDPTNMSLPLQLFLNGARTTEARDLVGLITGNLVQNENSKVISDTFAGQDIEYVVSDTFKVNNNSAGTKVLICPEETEYKANTVESAALNVTYFINKTYKKVSELLPTVQIDPVALKINPNIRETYVMPTANGAVTETYYRTDNAYYQPSEKSITFLPHSKALRKTGFSMSFWEVPMVASHEYGHHIFQSIVFGTQTSATTPALMSKKSGLMGGCFGDHETPSRKPKKNKIAQPRKVTLADVVGSYNEGFADLMSYYTLENNERGLSGVKCLEVSRDVNSATFFDGKPKNFSREAMASFFSTVEETARGCEVTQYQGIHVIGSIFAYSANRFLNHLTDSKDDKLAVTLLWAQAIKTNAPYLVLYTPENLNRALFAMFVKAGVKKLNKSLDNAICADLEKIYPGMTPSLSECKGLI